MIEAKKDFVWFRPGNSDEIATPALLIFPHRVEQNIERLITIAGDVNRLRPHVKTHKLPQIVAMHQKRGIYKLKCSTIAEAEMLARAGVPDVLLAYQPVGPNQQRLIELAQAFPTTQFGCLVDNEKTLRELAAKMTQADFMLNVWIDIDNGMGRTGVQPGTAADNLAKLIDDAPNLTFAGLHVYDGQFSREPIDVRTEKSDAAFEPVRAMIARLAEDGVDVKNIVAGGSPTFAVHASLHNVDLSPGTYVFWDAGYATLCPELPFEPAAVVMTRVVSKPASNRLCLDLGHKAIAAENPIDKRVRFLNAPDAKFKDHKEEHLVIEVPSGSQLEVGYVLYGIPWHICPTVALYQEAIALDEEGELIGRWPIEARGRRLTF